MIDLHGLIQQCAPNVAPNTLMSVMTIESAHKPEAIGFLIKKDGRKFLLTSQPKTKTEAINWADWLLENGYRFDAGIAQVNSTNFGRFGLTAKNVFDPCTNISAAGKIFTEFYVTAKNQYGEGQTALLAAISAYQSGNHQTGFKTWYVQKAVKANNNSVQQFLKLQK